MDSMTVETNDGVKLSARLFKPADLRISDYVVVLVHPFTVLGGFQGLLRGIASGLAERGFCAVTFDMRGAGRSSGRPSLTGFTEIGDVVAVCKWVSDTLSPRGIVLVGSSAGNQEAQASSNNITSGIRDLLRRSREKRTVLVVHKERVGERHVSHGSKLCGVVCKQDRRLAWQA
ncbi:hypothetical protein KFK09_012519 [Dendrobium nobile]|uniref:AB hydrolase-1 domain-containing protein n=1 Tax=Dendrobium nobile TaxID=94219 RepID=A0A8T3BJ81_DENNO|nr:hypothetical protein KFK09_012519 [Dendrobium nobile]